MDDKELHTYAREVASSMRTAPNKKQLRFNEIVETAKEFYRADVKSGIKELVISCFPVDETGRDNCMYDKKSPMWEVLQKDYKWML
jgi:hypothetical protein